ncbi:hypothetical protein [Frateuria defendens]|uniref:ApeI family dehydratase n=1 Tax=Frateuria defendens TaxID=2219559 RepID=UPI00066FF5D4|nr:hypothetical protein [Frateuria defendens]
MSRPTLPELLDERRLEDGSWSLSLRVPPDLAQLEGHFPEAAIVPGVVQVAWALELAAPRLGTSRRCREMEALKFQQLLRPGDLVDLQLRFDAAKGKLYFALAKGEAHYSAGRLCLGGG